MIKFIFSVLVIFSATVYAENARTVCDSGDVRHIIQVVYPHGWDVPCEVHFETPGDSRVIWKAEIQVGFCERKAQEIVDRRISGGWHCEEQALLNGPALTESSLISDLPPPTR